MAGMSLGKNACAGGIDDSGIRLEFAGEREPDGSNEPLPAAPTRGL